MLSQVLRLNLCLLIIGQPRVGIGEMVASAAAVLQPAGITVKVAFTRQLCRPELSRITIGNCLIGQMTIEQLQLFDLREGAGTSDIVVYFLEETIPASLGCAAHPAGKPALIITQLANRWTLAHELGHVLGLRHVDEKRRLMTSAGTGSFDTQVPLLTDYEVEVLRHSVGTLCTTRNFPL